MNFPPPLLGALHGTCHNSKVLKATYVCRFNLVLTSSPYNVLVIKTPSQRNSVNIAWA